MRNKLILIIILLAALNSSAGNLIDLKIQKFSTDFAPPDFSGIGLGRTESKSDFDYYLVQFDSKTQLQYKQTLERNGSTIIDYIPEDAFIMKMDRKALEFAKSRSFVKFIQIWQPAYRISPDLLNREQTATTKETSGRITLIAKAFDGEDYDSFSKAISLIEGVKLIEGGEYTLIEVNPEDAMKTAVKIANLPQTYWVERRYPFELHNTWSRWILDSFDTLNMAAGFGGGAWSAQLRISTAADSSLLPMYAHGLYGQNQIAGDDDTGLDWDNVYFRDPSQSVVYDKDDDSICESVNMSHRKIVAYNAYQDTFDLNSSGHGTHTCGSITGDSLGSNLPNDTILSRGMGMAPLAKLAFVDIGGAGDGLYLPANIGYLYRWMYNAGARVSSSSWGQSSGGLSSYTLDARNVDFVAWDHKDMCLFRSAGNSNNDGDSVNSPATAKNIVTVGATESGFGSGSTTWGDIGSTTRNELLDVAEFSSHGPTKEGLRKPELCATGGWYIWSADSDGDLSSNNSGITYMGGTSMSTPTTAGLALLVRQYFTEGWYPSGLKTPGDAVTPSGALIKAMLINSTRNSPGAYSTDAINSSASKNAPSMGQGWGRVVMSDVIYFDGDARKLYVVDEQSGFTTSGQSDQYTLKSGSSTGEYLKVVLVYTDYPAATSPASVLVNNLDLEVNVGGTTYLGNVFGTNARSVSGGSADNVNVTEVVWLDASPSSDITINVKATSINTGPQPYALVVTGDLDMETDSVIKYIKHTVVDTVSGGTLIQDSKLESGETADLDVFIRNDTGSSQTGITGVLRSGSAFITVTDSTGVFGDLTDGDTSNTLFRVFADASTPNNTACQCSLFVSYGTVTDTSTFYVTVYGSAVVSMSKDSLIFNYASKNSPVEALKNEITPKARIFKKDALLHPFISPKIDDINIVTGYDTLQYDDGGYSSWWYGVNYFAVKFTPASKCSLKTVFWARYSDIAQTDTLFVWSDNGGLPGVLQYNAPVNMSTTGSDIIMSKDVNSGSYSSSFWCGVFTATSGTAPESYLIGDASGGANSYFSSNRSSWTNMASYDSDLIIRAEVAYFTEATDSADFYVLNTDAASTKSVKVNSITSANSSSWISSISPDTGTVDIGDSLGIRVYIDTTGLAQTGDYIDTLLISTDADSIKSVTLKLPIKIHFGSAGVEFGFKEQSIDRKGVFSISLHSSIAAAGSGFYVNSPSFEDLLVEIVDVQGRIAKRVFSGKNSGRRQFTIPKDLPSGVYVIKAVSGKETAYKRIVILK